MLRSFAFAISLAAAFSAGNPVRAQAAPPEPTALAFVENCGQVDGPAGFTAARGGVRAFFSADTIALQLPGVGVGSLMNLLFRFEGASAEARVEGVGAPSGTVNCYRGADPSRWVEGARSYRAVRYRQLYPGIDVEVHDACGRLEYDLLLAPGADASALVMRCEGADALELRDDGTLLAHTAAGPVMQSIPACWQVREDGTREPLTGRFVMLEGAARFGFAVDGRDPALAMVIDPGLTYGTFLGGTTWDKVTAVARGAGSSVYVAGFTTSAGFPVVAGAVQGTLAGYSDAFVAKLDMKTGSLVWSTFLGGTDTVIFVGESATGVVVDGSGAAFVAGWANSANFPTTVGAYQPASGGGIDAFAAKIRNDGTLQWSSYLGGGKEDRAEALALASDGVLVTGRTFSDSGPAFPTTAGALDTSFNSIFLSDDAFVSKLALDGSGLTWSTFVGGVLRDEGAAITVDAAGAAYVTGLTGSTDFPVTAGAWDTSFNGLSASEWGTFVLKLTPGGNALSWSTHLGGQMQSEGHGIALDAAGSPVVAGVTRTADFPFTAGALQTSYGGGASDAFVTRLAANGSALSWSSYLGGAGDDDASAVALDSAGAPVVAGSTTSSVFPVTAGAVSGTLHGASDGFVAKIAGGGSNGAPGGGGALLYGSYLGGAADDGVLALALDVHGAALVGGETQSSDFGTTAGAVDASYNGGRDGFVARVQVPPWADLGFAKAGLGGSFPLLVGTGSLQAGTPGALTLSGARPSALCILFAGFAAGNVPLKGGTLVPFPPVVQIAFNTSPAGGLLLPFAAWPTGLPAGFKIVYQEWVADPAATLGAAASNGLQSTQP